MDAHRIRNHKTSNMFTLSVAFLFFSASSFQLLITLVVKGFGKQIGSDVLIWAPVSLLEEGKLAAYLDQKKWDADHLVQDYAFMSI